MCQTYDTMANILFNKRSYAGEPKVTQYQVGGFIDSDVVMIVMKDSQQTEPVPFWDETEKTRIFTSRRILIVQQIISYRKPSSV